MSKRIDLFCMIALLVGGVLGTAIVVYPRAASQPKYSAKALREEEVAQARFEILKKELPSIFSACCQSQLFLRDPEVRVARLTATTEAKITFVADGSIYKDGRSDCFFVFYLRYHGGVWTIVRWEAGGSNIERDHAEKFIQSLALAVDQQGGG